MSLEESEGDRVEPLLKVVLARSKTPFSYGHETERGATQRSFSEIQISLEDRGFQMKAMKGHKREIDFLRTALFRIEGKRFREEERRNAANTDSELSYLFGFFW